MAAPILSREDIEQIAGRVLSIYTEAYVPERHLFYQVNPEELADVLGLEVDYQIPSPDGSILGVTSPDEQYVPVYYNGEECYYYLDGNTILIDVRLCASAKTIGRKNYTLAHEIAHQMKLCINLPSAARKRIGWWGSTPRAFSPFSITAP